MKRNLLNSDKVLSRSKGAWEREGECTYCVVPVDGGPGDGRRDLVDLGPAARAIVAGGGGRGFGDIG